MKWIAVAAVRAGQLQVGRIAAARNFWPSIGRTHQTAGTLAQDHNAHGDAGEHWS